VRQIRLLVLVVGAFVFAALAVGAAFLLFDVGDSGSDTGDSGDESPDEVLDRAQRALDAQEGYRIEVSGQNFVLPQWGGVDDGTVDIENSPSGAEARLYRTGDGEYEMLYTEGQTYFKRTTCEHFARVPGGGYETMLPFLLSETQALAKAEGRELSKTAPQDQLVVVAEMDYLGSVGVQIDAGTYLPTYILKPSATEGGGMTWAFSGWGEAPDVRSPEGEVPDQGPGGNPC
jgi:hypothetical protein